MTKPSATLHRLHDLDALAVAKRLLVPAPARHHLAVERDRDAARLGRGACCHDRVAHARAVFELARLAVQHDPHACTPASISATALAVTGASRTPLRKWPVAHTTPSRSSITGELSGVPGRSRAAASTSSNSSISGSTSHAASSRRWTPPAVTVVSKPRSSTVAPTTTSPRARETT